MNTFSKMIMRTAQERKEAVKLLKENREVCVPTNFFGEDNLKRIDIAVDVIENNRNQDYIYDKYKSHHEDGSEDTVGHGNWRSAMSALNFLRGNSEIEDLLYPLEEVYKEKRGDRRMFRQGLKNSN